jgi:hypothetical protein
MKRDVTMMALMESLDPYEIGDRPYGGRGAFALPGDGGGVVTEDMHRVFTNVNILGEDI